MLVRAASPLLQGLIKQEPVAAWATDWDLEQEQKNNRGAEVSFMEEVLDKPAYLFYTLPAPERVTAIECRRHSLADVFLETQTPPPNIA